MDPYAGTYTIRWADLDANGHANYSAFIDAAADLRYRFFAERGFPPAAFLKLGVGAVYTSLSARFLREVLVGESLSITYSLAGMSPSGIRWKIRHDILKSNGKKAVVLDVEGVVFDLARRRAVVPSAELLAVFNQVPRLPTFETLPEPRSIGQADLLVPDTQASLPALL
jgi:acyl-CoA thioester hydrolase